MASDTVAAPESRHPSPHRGRVGLRPLLLGLVGAPLAWSSHELIAATLAGYACYPNDAPRTAPIPGWGWVWPVMLVVCLLALAAGIAAGWVSYRNWSAVREEYPGNHRHLIDAGEGRTRFLAMWGMLCSIGFGAAIIFDTVSLFIVPLCGP